MICKNCDTDNPESAVFCKNCGKRMDGQSICPHCGNETPADGKFCITCGAKLTAEPAAKPKVHFAAQDNTVAVAGGKFEKVKSVLNIVAIASAIACAVFAIIFVFLMGTEVSVVIDNINITKKLDIKYYFGDCYKDYDKYIELVKKYNSTAGANDELMTYFTADVSLINYIFGTVVLAGSIISVLVLSTLAIVYGALNLCGKSKKNAIGYAVSAFLIYIAGCVIILSLVNSGEDFSDQSKATLNGATVAGISLCSVFAIISVGCKFAMRGKQLATADAIINYAFAAGCAVLVAVVLGLAAKPSVGDRDIKITFSGLINLIGLACASSEYLDAAENAYLLTALAAVSIGILLLIAVFAALTLNSHSKTLQGKKSKSLAFCATLTGLTIVILVLTILCCRETENLFNNFVREGLISDDGEESKFDYAVPITMLVLSALALIAEIVRTVLNGVRKRSADTEAEV